MPDPVRRILFCCHWQWEGALDSLTTLDALSTHLS